MNKTNATETAATDAGGYTWGSKNILASQC
jgi:hypothetical protein